jgi:hypothetical protein
MKKPKKQELLAELTAKEYLGSSEDDLVEDAHESESMISGGQFIESRVLLCADLKRELSDWIHNQHP